MLDKYMKNPRVFIKKIINRDEIIFNVKIEYEKNTEENSLPYEVILIPPHPFKTKQEVAEALKEKLKQDREKYELPNLEYDIKDVEIIYIERQIGSPEERSELRNNIETLLFD